MVMAPWTIAPENDFLPSTHPTKGTLVNKRQSCMRRRGGCDWLCALGMSSVTVCSDSEVALAQVLSLRACSHLQHQQATLRSLARVLWTSGLVVRLV